jgi:hypothetical protein
MKFTATTKKLLMLMLVLAVFINGASATIDTANITDAIAVLGIVGSGFINVLKVIFVDNLGTIILLGLIGIILALFGGFANMILKFAFSIIGNIGSDLGRKYGK